MNKPLTKPLTVAIEDLRQSLIQCIVDSQLHMAIVKLVVDDIKRSVDQEYERILKAEREVYAKSQNAPSTIVEQQVIPNEEFKDDTNPVDNEEGHKDG